MVPVTFLQVDLDRDLSFSRLIECMIGAGWLINGDDGGGAILCDRDGSYDWLYRPESEMASLRAQLQQRFLEGWTVGTVLRWSESPDVNINVTLRPQDGVSIMIGAERKVLTGMPELTDVSWYLSRLVPALIRADREASILKIEWSEVW